MKPIAVLLASEQARSDVLTGLPPGASIGVPMYALADTDLRRFCCLVIPTSADQRELLRQRTALQAFLDAGGKIVFNGHVVYPFLDGLRPYQPAPESGLAGLQVHNLAAHPIWAGVEGRDLTLRKGVAGFYGRGFNPPPPGALAITLLGTLQRVPIDWMRTYPSGGQLLVHAGNDFLSFGDAPSARGMRTAFWNWATAAPQPLPCPAVRHCTDEADLLPAGESIAPVRAPQVGNARPCAHVLWIENGSYFHHRTLHTPEWADRMGRHCHVRDLRAQDLDGIDTLVVCSNTRGDLMARHRPLIDRFLHDGNTVIALGNTAPEQWLPGIRWTDCPVNFWWWTTPGADSGLRLSWPGHSLFKHLSLADATWHQHGTFAPPPGARSLIDKLDHGSVLYEDCHSTPGRIIATTLDPCYHHGSYFMPATTRFLRGLLAWLDSPCAPRPRR